MSSTVRQAPGYEPADILRGLYGDGIIGLAGAFSTDFADKLREDIDLLFAEAQAIQGGILPRGPNRYYVEVQPERISGFNEIVTHPWFMAVCKSVLGEDYKIVEVGFDIPFPGAADQPWHRDFAPPVQTTRDRRLNSLAFNLTAVDTVPEMGPFEIAPGTQWDSFEGCPRGMFPPRELWGRYIERAVQKMPQRGDMSARSALTIHRGTANRSQSARPVLVIGVDAPDGTNAGHHDLQVTRTHVGTMPDAIRNHMTYRLVDQLEPVIQNHVIEGLLTPEYS